MANPFKDAETPESVIYQLAGAASVCWEHLDRAGTFQSEKAKEFCEATIERLEEFGVKIRG